jgi:hypothetical protein
MDWADYLRGETAKYRQLAETAEGCPIYLAIERFGGITSQSVLGGLHHQYCRI